MKANGKFFRTMFLINLLLGAVGFLITWGVLALTKYSVIGLIICAVVCVALASYINIFVVKKSKLKIPYFIFGTVVNAIFAIVPPILIIILR